MKEQLIESYGHIFEDELIDEIIDAIKKGDVSPEGGSTGNVNQLRRMTVKFKQLRKKMLPYF